MANKMSVINVNVPADVKEEANELFNSLGLNMSTAINIFLKRAIVERGIPFDVKEMKPSKKLAEAINELKYMESHPEEYESYNNIEELKKCLLTDD